ncbi:hypothetical protein [Moheibacter sp.]|uniref:hypothetical protein n=1 Tax=Moheibacter sp. TaxID=1965316 RepID=UPI003C7251D3
MEKVIIEKSVMDYFDGLIFKLFEEEYFGFLDASLNYVDKILDFLLRDLPDTPHKISPSELVSYGSYYTFHKANNTTTWFIFFEIKEDKFVVRKILNNHQPEIRFMNL